MNLPEKRQELRSRIPASYDGGLHLLFMFAFATAMVALGLSRLDHPRWWEWAFLPGFFLFANVFEWFYHKGPLHTPGFDRNGYDSHARQHHIVFTEDDMPLKTWNDLKMTLFAPQFLLVILGIVLVFGLPLGILVSWNLFWMFLASAYGYYWIYELLHTMHHAPEGLAIGQHPLFKWLRKHHARHHNLRRMTAGNFNVSFPLTDYLFGSVLEESLTSPAEDRIDEQNLVEPPPATPPMG